MCDSRMQIGSDGTNLRSCEKCSPLFNHYHAKFHRQTLCLFFASSMEPNKCVFKITNASYERIKMREYSSHYYFCNLMRIRH